MLSTTATATATDQPSAPTSDAGDAAEDTAAAILDAAEAVFADLGFAGATTRAIAERAGVNLGLIHYHHGSKEQLFTAAFRRRATQLNDRRRVMLAGLGADPSLGDLVDCFLRPAIEIGRGHPGLTEGAGHFGSLLATVASGTDARARALTSDAFDPIAHVFIAAFRRAAPGLDQDRATRGYLFAVSISVALMADTGRGRGLSGDDGHDADPARVIAAARDFICAGLEGLANTNGEEREDEERNRRNRAGAADGHGWRLRR